MTSLSPDGSEVLRSEGLAASRPPNLTQVAGESAQEFETSVQRPGIAWLLASGATIVVLMDALNSTIFSIARPHIMGDTHATPDEASWINLGYLMAKLSLLPAAAWFVDRSGERFAIQASMATVATASVVCALSPNLPLLVAGRVVQGAAGAVLLVSAQTILFRMFPGRIQGLVQAVFGLGVVMAPIALAPAVQGWLTDSHSWNWVFWLNPGIALAALACFAPFRNRLPNKTRTRRPFAWWDFALISLAVSALTYVLIEGARWNWFDAPHIQLWIWIGTGSLIACVGSRLIGRNPPELFDRTVFRDAQFAFGFLVSFVAGFALTGSAFLVSTFGLNVLNLPADDLGRLLAPSSLTVGAGLLLGGALIAKKRIHPLKLVPFGIALVMAAMWQLSGSNLSSGMHDLGPALLMHGLGLGLLFLALTLVTLNGLSPERLTSGVAMFAFGRQMGGTIGIAFLQTYLDRQVSHNRRVLIENLNSANSAFLERQDAVAEALISRGYDPGLANHGAASVIQAAVRDQVAALSFNEAFFSLVMLFVAAIPVLLAFRLAQTVTGRIRQTASCPHALPVSRHPRNGCSAL